MPDSLSRRHLLASGAALALGGCSVRLDRDGVARPESTRGLPWDAEPFASDLVWLSATPALADAVRSLSVGDRYGVVVRHVHAPETAIVGAAHVGPSPTFETARGEAWLNWGVDAGPSALAYAHELGHALGYRHPEPGEHDSRLMRPNVDVGQVRDGAYDAALDPVTLAIAAALPWVDVYEWGRDPAATLRPLVDRWREDRLADGDLDWALRRFDDAAGRDVWFGDPNPGLDVVHEGEALALDGVGRFYRP